MTIIAICAAVLFAAMWVAEMIAGRQAERLSEQLLQQLDSEYAFEIRQQQEVDSLRTGIETALHNCNAANLRAARSANAIKELPVLRVSMPDTLAAYPFHQN